MAKLHYVLTLIWFLSLNLLQKGVDYHGLPTGRCRRTPVTMQPMMPTPGWEAFTYLAGA